MPINHDQVRAGTPQALTCTDAEQLEKGGGHGKLYRVTCGLVQGGLRRFAMLWTWGGGGGPTNFYIAAVCRAMNGAIVALVANVKCAWSNVSPDTVDTTFERIQQCTKLNEAFMGT